MAAFASAVSRNLMRLDNNCMKALFRQQGVLVNASRNNSFFQHLANKTEHGNDYEYEVSKDPEEWKYVERLMPYKTVPEPKVLPSYPSGWRPMSDKALDHPYFVDRSKNHMLSVYLVLKDRGQVKHTQIKKIRGDIWALHDELKTHIEEQIGKKINSLVHEGNNSIKFKGDHVYLVEQWMLSKGF